MYCFMIKKFLIYNLIFSLIFCAYIFFLQFLCPVVWINFVLTLLLTLTAVVNLITLIVIVVRNRR